MLRADMEPNGGGSSDTDSKMTPRAIKKTLSTLGRKTMSGLRSVSGVDSDAGVGADAVADELALLKKEVLVLKEQAASRWRRGRGRSGGSGGSAGSGSEVFSARLENVILRSRVRELETYIRSVNGDPELPSCCCCLWWCMRRRREPPPLLDALGYVNRSEI